MPTCCQRMVKHCQWFIIEVSGSSDTWAHHEAIHNGNQGYLYIKKMTSSDSLGMSSNSQYFIIQCVWLRWVMESAHDSGRVHSLVKS